MIKKLKTAIFVVFLAVGIIVIASCKCTLCPDEEDDDDNRLIASTGLVTVMANQPGLCIPTGYFSL